MTTETLSALIGSVLDETDLMTPEAVADEVANRTSDDLLGSFYRQALRERVRAAMQLRTAKAMCTSIEDTQDSPTGHSASDIHAVTAGRGPSPKQKPIMSAKFALINEAHLARLREIVLIDGDRKRFGDLTRGDLLTAAKTRDEMAARNLTMADKYRRVEKEMERLGVEKVSDLPADVLDEALKG